MLPIIEGVIARRVLLNFRVDADVARKLVPEPLELHLKKGWAMAGVCLIRLEQLRPRGLPAFTGLSSENMAHRIAVRYPCDGGMKDGVYILRRETDQAFVSLLGGHLFPGVHHRAQFDVIDGHRLVGVDVRTRDHKADVTFAGLESEQWQATPAFATFGEASEFFRRGCCGFSLGSDGRTLEGMRLETRKWEMKRLRVTELYAGFFEDNPDFPRGSVRFDNALLMRNIPHEWHEVKLADPAREAEEAAEAELLAAAPAWPGM